MKVGGEAMHATRVLQKLVKKKGLSAIELILNRIGGDMAGSWLEYRRRRLLLDGLLHYSSHLRTLPHPGLGRQPGGEVPQHPNRNNTHIMNHS